MLAALWGLTGTAAARSVWSAAAQRPEAPAACLHRPVQSTDQHSWTACSTAGAAKYLAHQTPGAARKDTATMFFACSATWKGQAAFRACWVNSTEGTDPAATTGYSGPIYLDGVLRPLSLGLPSPTSLQHRVGVCSTRLTRLHVRGWYPLVAV